MPTDTSEENTALDDLVLQALSFLSAAPLSPPKNIKTLSNSKQSTFTKNKSNRLSSRAAIAFYEQNYTVLKNLQEALLGFSSLYNESVESEHPSTNSCTTKSVLKSSFSKSKKLKNKKSVTFNQASLNQFCFFLKATCPFEIQTSARYDEPDGIQKELPEVPSQRTFILTGLNFSTSPVPPFDHGDSPVRLINLTLDPIDKKKLIGILHCKNLAFEKKVTVRYTFDSWKTFSETQANFVNVHQPAFSQEVGIDRFGFEIKDLEERLSNDSLAAKKLEFAIRYQVNHNNVYWNNNNDKNFCVLISASEIKTNPPSSKPITIKQPLKLATPKNDLDDIPITNTNSFQSTTKRSVVLRKTSSYLSPNSNPNVKYYGNLSPKPIILGNRADNKGFATKNDYSSQMQDKIASWYKNTIAQKEQHRAAINEKQQRKDQEENLWNVSDRAKITAILLTTTRA